jgi:hypothetical protein
MLANAQDVITKKNGDDIQAKVIEITLNELKYKNFNNLDGPVISILKSEVILVRYENGSKDIFADEKPINISQNEILDDDQAIFNGQQDANKYYKNYSGAGVGTLATGLFLGSVLALIPAITTANAVPRDENLQYPSITLMKNQNYARGYTQQAFKIKKERVWNNYIIALAANVVTYLLLVKAIK